MWLVLIQNGKFVIIQTKHMISITSLTHIWSFSYTQIWRKYTHMRVWRSRKHSRATHSISCAHCQPKRHTHKTHIRLFWMYIWISNFEVLGVARLLLRLPLIMPYSALLMQTALQRIRIRRRETWIGKFHVVVSAAVSLSASYRERLTRHSN